MSSKILGIRLKSGRQPAAPRATSLSTSLLLLSPTGPILFSFPLRLSYPDTETNPCQSWLFWVKRKKEKSKIDIDSIINNAYLCETDVSKCVWQQRWRFWARSSPVAPLLAHACTQVHSLCETCRFLSFTLAFSLSSHRSSYINLVFRSRFLDS
jgi:hypothetical protein